jgi:zinc transport system substrate-binding protein
MTKQLLATIVIILAGLFTLAVSAQEKTGLGDKDIAVSIAPLHSLVANITKGVAEPQLLLPQNASPHNYVLKPSDARQLARAKIVFIVSSGLEVFLAKPIKTLANQAELVQAVSGQSGSLNPKNHGHDASDLHIWLDPVEAKTIVKNIAQSLKRRDPAHAETYDKNLATTLIRLDELDRFLQQKLSKLPPVFVFHNAYSHLAERYKFTIAGVVTNNPAISGGARKMAKIRQTLRASNARCIFSEPQFNPKLITAITSRTSIKLGILDPLGSDIEPGPDHYFTMMKNLAESLVSCGK